MLPVRKQILVFTWKFDFLSISFSEEFFVCANNWNDDPGRSSNDQERLI